MEPAAAGPRAPRSSWRSRWRHWRWLLVPCALLVIALVLARRGPAPAPPGDPPFARRLQRDAHVVLITFDGPLRDDVLSGPMMPGLQRAIRERGVAFPARTASPLAKSLVGYQAIAAGRTTPCLDNGCGRIAEETLAEGVARRLHLGPDDVAVFASWSRLRDAASAHDGAVLVDVPPEGPPHAAGPPWPDARFDDETFARARAHFRAHHPRLLHLALLDTDEWAHAGAREGYQRALRANDARVLEVLEWVDALPARERAVTTVLLSADHGRGRDDWRAHGLTVPGSREIFIAALGPLVHGGAAPEADQRDLRPTIERLLGLCPEPRWRGGEALEAICGGLPCLP